MTEHYLLRYRAVFLALAALVISAGSLSAQWTSLPDLPAGRIYTMSAILDGKLYVFGGFDGSAARSDAWRIDLADPSGGWEGIQGLQDTRAGGYAAAYNGKIYILGGFGIDGGTLTMRPNVLEYDPALNSYTSKAAQPSGSWFSGGALNGTKVYIISGLTRVGSNNSFTPNTYIYDIASDSWTTGPSVLLASYWGYAGVISGTIYYAGGYTSSGAAGDGVQKLTSGATSWQSASGTMYRAVYGGSAGVLNNKLYVAGGTADGQTPTAIVQQYDPATSTWSAYYPLPAADMNGPSNMPGDGTSLYKVPGTVTPRPTLKMDIVAPRPVAVAAPTSLSYGVGVGGSRTKSVTIGNNGIANLTGTVEIPSNAPWLTTNTANFSLTPFNTNSVNLTADATGMTPGTYTTTVNLKSNDPNNATIAVAVTMYVAASIAEQPTRVVMEEATGTWCPPCGAYGIPAVEQAMSTYGEQLIAIAYHDRGGGGTRIDTLYTANTEAINQKLGVPYFPAAAVSRYFFSGARMVGSSNFSAAVGAVLSFMPNAPATLEVEKYSYDAATRKVTAHLVVNTSDAVALNGGTLRITGVVMEDSVLSFQNGADGQSTKYPYYHNHVARAFWPDINGRALTIPPDATAEGGSVLLPGKKIELDVSWTLPAKSASAGGWVKRNEKANVVWILSTNDAAGNFGPILQGEELALTSSIGIGKIAITKDVDSKTIDMGQTATFSTGVSNLTTAPMEITLRRVSENLPATWTSQLCVGGDCSAPSIGSVMTTVAPGGTANFGLKVLGATADASGTVTVEVSAADTTYTITYTTSVRSLGIDDATTGAASLEMSAYPNPTSGDARVEFTTRSAGVVSIDVFSAAGVRVLSLPARRYESGPNAAALDLSTLPSGMYTVAVNAGAQRAVRTITVVH